MKIWDFMSHFMSLSGMGGAGKLTSSNSLPLKTGLKLRCIHCLKSHSTQTWRLKCIQPLYLIYTPDFSNNNVLKESAEVILLQQHEKRGNLGIDLTKTEIQRKEVFN